MTTLLTSAPTKTVVAARTVDAVKIYGQGDTEVRALDGVTIGFETGRLTAIMGPSGRENRRCCTVSPVSTHSLLARSSSVTRISRP